MYSKGNLQHLGERHEALSNLTWFEGLLIARVHPAISVVTLTATGLLCYAGHVCNYFQKSFEWFLTLLNQLEVEQSTHHGALENSIQMHMYMTAAQQKTDMKGTSLFVAKLVYTNVCTKRFKCFGWNDI